MGIERSVFPIERRSSPTAGPEIQRILWLAESQDLFELAERRPRSVPDTDDRQGLHGIYKVPEKPSP